MTVPKLAAKLTAKHSRDIPPWKVREIVDSLEVEIPRVGLYRLVPESVIPLVEAALRDGFWLPAPHASEAAQC